MIIEVMYKAKLPPTFVDSRSRNMIGGISSLACKTTYRKNRRCLVSLKCKSACHAFHIAEHWTKARYRRASTFTRSESNVLLARQQWPCDVIGTMPVTIRSRFEIDVVRPKLARVTN